ncbi:aldehyde ferredoxin oxidoreductase family protein, partial [Chloroflexota bacterium]
GIITGSPIGGSGRNAICTKSPLSNAFNTSEVGGFWGAELKHAGFDMVIVEGKSEKPVYILIRDDIVEIKDAGHLWGKSVKETDELIKKENEDAMLRTALIGQGGEKLVRFSCIVNDIGHFAGRGGSGAVMGSKNLKGIAVRGHNPPAASDPQKVADLAKWMREQIKTPWLEGLHAVGTIAGPVAYSKAGGLGTHNFRDGVFPDVENISPENYFEQFGSERDTCYACPVRCKHKINISDTHGYDFTHNHHHGPEYEALVSYGPLCGISDLQAIACANELSSAYGIDVLSCGATVAFAMECFENGLITEKDTGGIALNFGNVQAMLQMVEMIGERKGFGDVLAEGTVRAAERIGKGALHYSMQSRSVEFSMQNPYFKPILGLGYAVCPTGADHMRNLNIIHVIDAEKAGVGSHAESREPYLRQFKSLGLHAPVYRKQLLNNSNIRTLIYSQIYATAYDSLCMCSFLTRFPPDNLANIINAVTGWETNVWEVMKVGEKGLNMMRAFNVREGFTREDDNLPQRFFEPLNDGPMKGTKLDKEEFEKSKDTYYAMMCWDKQGIPSAGKLLELGIDWVADDILGIRVN